MTLKTQIRKRYKLKWYITEQAWLLWTNIMNIIVPLTSVKPKNSSIIPRGPRQNGWLSWLQDGCERYSLVLAGNQTAVFQFLFGHHADNICFTLILKKSYWRQIKQRCKLSIYSCDLNFYFQIFWKPLFTSNKRQHVYCPERNLFYIPSSSQSF